MRVVRVSRTCCSFLSTFTWRTLAVCASLLLLYNEYFSYVVYSWMWDKLEVTSNSSSSSLRVLFVADPQVVREPYTGGSLIEWDSDSYLHRTFSLAVSRFSPDVIAYLGDLMDDGSSVQETRYHKYALRFKQIFTTESNIKHVYLSGDNDIGGELFDIKTEDKMLRFDAEFSDSGVVSVGFVDFLRLHYDYAHLPEEVSDEIKRLVGETRNNIRVLLNHMTLLKRPKQHVNPVILPLKPSIVFTAHSHTASLSTCLDCWTTDMPTYIDAKSGSVRIPLKPWTLAEHTMHDSRRYTLTLNDGVSIHEIAVPTCNYRMGEAHTGYGAAVFSSGGEVTYSVYWLPSRYTQLFSYVYMLVGMVVGLAVCKGIYYCRNYTCVRKTTTKTAGICPGLQFHR